MARLIAFVLYVLREGRANRVELDGVRAINAALRRHDARRGLRTPVYCETADGEICRVTGARARGGALQVCLDPGKRWAAPTSVWTLAGGRFDLQYGEVKA